MEQGILDRPNTMGYKSTATPQSWFLQVHAESMIEQGKQTVYYRAALYSGRGTVLAAERISQDKTDCAFVFTGSADHHAVGERF